MRQNFQYHFALLIAFSVSTLPATLLAQQGKKAVTPAGNTQPAGKAGIGKAATPQGQEKNPIRQASEKKPQAAPAVDLVSPELEKLLKQWEVESAKIKSLHGKHTRRQFNKTFEVEKVSEGEFFLETPDKGRIDMIAVKPKPGEVSKRTNADGKPYSLEQGPSERWICTGADIYEFNEDEHTYSLRELPENMRGKNIVHSPLPFLFGMKAEEAKARFNLEIMGIDSKNDIVKLKAVPKLDSDRQNYKEAYIWLDNKRFVPSAVQLVDPHGEDTAYKFKDIVINDGNFLQKIGSRFRGNPYKPSVSGYTKVIPDDTEAMPAKAGGGAGAIKQTSGAAPQPGPGTPKRTADSNPNGKAPAGRATPAPQPAKK